MPPKPTFLPSFKSLQSGFRQHPTRIARILSFIAIGRVTGLGEMQITRAAALMVVSILAVSVQVACGTEEPSPSPTPDVKATAVWAATATATREWAAQNRATAEAEQATRVVTSTPTPTPYAKPVDADALREMAAHASERGSSRAGVVSELKAEGARYLEHAEHCTVFSRNDSEITVWAQRWEHRVRLFCNEHPEWSLDPLCTDMGQKIQSCFGRGY